MTAQENRTKVDELLKDKFLGDVSLLLKASNPKGKAFLNYLQRVGRQLNIKDLDAYELLSYDARLDSYRGHLKRY
jgi:hypothetical protein